ncbi:MAG TPA: UPF0223 family protein [Virgibacillus sp.]|nr:UPF0223 family protein [Virgibacillus sp.]
MNYSYPIEETWTTEEIIDVVQFFELIEKAYEKGAAADDVLEAYNRFKQIVPSKSEEKTYFREFEHQSGYVSYNVVKKAKNANKHSKIKL